MRYIIIQKHNIMAQNLSYGEINFAYALSEADKHSIFMQIGIHYIILVTAWIVSIFTAYIFISSGNYYKDRLLRYTGYLSTFPTLFVIAVSLNEYLTPNTKNEGNIENNMIVILIVYLLFVIIAYAAVLWNMFVSYILIKKGIYYVDNTLLYSGYIIGIPTLLLFFDFTCGFINFYLSQ